MSTVLTLRLRGKTVDQIADGLGIGVDATRTMISAATRAAAAALSTYDKQELVALETARLDALMDAHWDAATLSANTRSADVVLKTIDRRAKLQGLEEHDDSTVTVATTVVVPNDPNGYVEALKQIAARSENVQEDSNDA